MEPLWPAKRPWASLGVRWVPASEGAGRLVSRSSESLGCPAHGVLAQSYLTLCDPVNWSPPGSSVLGFLQVRVLEGGCHFLLQVSFPAQRSNPGLLHCRRIFTIRAAGAQQGFGKGWLCISGAITVHGSPGNPASRMPGSDVPQLIHTRVSVATEVHHAPQPCWS